MILNVTLLKIATQAWLMQILVAGFNFFVLMNLVYELMWGYLVAHQNGMATSSFCSILKIINNNIFQLIRANI